MQNFMFKQEALFNPMQLVRCVYNLDFTITTGFE